MAKSRHEMVLDKLGDYEGLLIKVPWLQDVVEDLEKRMCTINKINDLELMIISDYSKKTETNDL